MASSVTKEVATEILPFIRVYKDGSVERLIDSSIVPPTHDLETGVSSKDITISNTPTICVRLYLPDLSNHTQKLPILVYYHGGAFCFESAFRFLHHRYLNHLVSHAKIVAVSVGYRLAPENPLPKAYEDSWVALNWVISHSICKENEDKEPWLINYGDFDRLYLGGDSAGGNIVHNMAIKVGIEGLSKGVKLLGAYLSHPYFWGSKSIGSESSEDFENSLPYLIWDLVYPNCVGGVDNPMINPFAPNAPKLDGLGCLRLLVCVAEKDMLRDRGVWYYNAVKGSEWKGEIELYEVEGEEHVFHILNYETEIATTMIKRLASFLV